MIKNLIKHETFIVLGVLMIFGTLAKLFGYIKLSSDWFWFIAGVALTIEGTINLAKERKFNKKYKVVPR